MRSRTRSGKGVIQFFCLCAALVLLFGTSTGIGLVQEPEPALQHPSTLAMSTLAGVVVPDVRGQRAEDAEIALRNAGFRPGSISTSPGPGVVGTVMQQEPVQNSTAPRGTTFNLVLVAPPAVAGPGDSEEEFSRQVPNLTALTPNQASNLLERSRLLLGKVSAGNGNGREGTIYTQVPPAGTWAKIGSRIDVTIVQPQKTTGGQQETVWVVVPNLVGQNEKSAEEMLRQNGLSAGSIFKARASVPVDTVFAQVPLSKTQVAQGTSVSLWVAEGPPQDTTVTVPDLTHRDFTVAKDLLAKSDLQLGESKSENSDEPANSIVAQSPEAGTRVERRTAVNVVIAQPIPLVTVPNLVQHDEADAIAILNSAGLQLGAVGERQGDESSGTVVSQQPQASAQVHVGTAVDVILSRQIVRQLQVRKDQADPKIDKPVLFQAHLEPPERGISYRFTFGDGEATGLQASSKTSHAYKKAGDFQVQAFATRGDTTITSEAVTVTIPSSFAWPVAVALTGGIVVLGGGSFVYHGRRQFHRLIRLATKLDPGTREVSMEGGEGWDPCVRVRLAQGPYETALYPAGRGPERKN